jgi:hypothetical protein
VRSGSDMNGPKCCCGCGIVVRNSFHKCRVCQGRTWAAFCLVGEEGQNGTCKACDKGRRAKGGDGQGRESEREFRLKSVGTIICGHPTDSQ